MTSPRALAHNKFLVVCDSTKKPRWVWTGSQNWTKTGLCTQANNSVLIDDPGARGEVPRAVGPAAGDAARRDARRPEDEQHASRARTSAGKVDDGSGSRRPSARSTSTEARKIIVGAKQAILFLMFNPGPSDTLLNPIIEKARKQEVGGKRLYIHGAINQDPSTTKNPVQLFDQSQLRERRLRRSCCRPRSTSRRSSSCAS